MSSAFTARLRFAQATASTPHLKDAPVAALPVYGVAHGYNQAAFLARIESGAGAAEIHSYPYLYNNIPINTTFFKLITRDTFRIEISSGEVITLLNDDPYPNDYALAYEFLRGDKANYVGMAESYRESLNKGRPSCARTRHCVFRSSGLITSADCSGRITGR